MNSNQLGSINNKPLSGLAARKAAANANALTKTETKTAIVKNPAEMPDRIGIGFDDSGSMSSHNKINNAHEGIEQFLRSCNKDTTAISIYPFNADPIVLTTELPAVALMVRNIPATGGTPLVSKCIRMLNADNLTRAIVFSDGQYYEENDQLVTLAKRKNCPIDTVYIAAGSGDENQKLQELAESTGGVYLRFELGKSNFRTAFKYLAPTYRAMLMAPGMKEKIENGEI